MDGFDLTAATLADILSGRRGWPTAQEFDAMSDRQRPDRARETIRQDDAPPRVIGTPQATPVQRTAPPDLQQEELDDGRVLHVAELPTRADLPGEMHTPAADVHETTADGRTIQIASKGVPIPLATARALGLVKDTKIAHETKDAHRTED